MDGLFPDLPEDISVSTDEDLATLISEHESAKELIAADDDEFLKGLDANEILAQLEKGGNQYQLLKDEQATRVGAHEAFQARKAELAAQFEVKLDEDSGDENDAPDSEKEVPVEVVADAEEVEETEEVEVEDKDRELVLASAEAVEILPRYSRRPPAPSVERTIVNEAPKGTALVAAGEMSASYREELDRESLALLVRDTAAHYGPMPKIHQVGEYRFGGPEHKFAKATFDFPEDRDLTGDLDRDTEKIRNVIVEGMPGGVGNYSLTASGGLCAPLEPIYTMQNFGTTAEPVWDALPIFRAARGGVNTPESTYIADITTAISSISEADDALGGTFATKSCQDLDCPPYTEVAVQILAHCREYGNLNARAWPEKIAHENELTMQALSRTSESFMLDRIKALSVNVTNGAETLGALVYLVDAVVKGAFGIRGRLRMPRESRFRAILPAWLPDMLVLDNVQTQFDRFRDGASLTAYLRTVGIDPVFYLDSPSDGTTQLPDASQAAGAIDGLPDNVQWALYPEGAFLGIDSGVLELGIVRDSVLNSTNDFQVFGERFRNLTRLAPAQACYWVTSDLCATGQFPPAGTVRTCD